MANKNSYESIAVISLTVGEEGIQALVEKFKKVIEKYAELDSVEEWGKRRLAYLINKEAEGYYVLFNFKATADFPAELDRRYKITDGILRSLIVAKTEQ
ncbi:MAG: 30S ribosomal protein S6 [Bacillota bacterium]|nr:30S ribosomal protein S6 [Bacillota bacterium]